MAGGGGGGSSTGGPFGDEIALQIIPLVDICFLLLTFLLMSSHPRIPQGEIESSLPDNGGPSRELPKTAMPDFDEIRITLLVAQGGDVDTLVPPRVEIDGRGSASAKGSGSLPWLEKELKRIGSNPTLRDTAPIIIEAEPHLAYRWVIKTLDICRVAQFKKVSFAASKRNNPVPGSPAP